MTRPNKNTKQVGQLAVAKAISYFTELGWMVFLPITDRGDIDIIVSPDGKKLYRVQCKYTSKIHVEMWRKYRKKVFEVDLRQMKERKSNTSKLYYTKDSFDILFILTEDASIYIVDWAKLCEEYGKIPTTLRLGKKIEKFLLKFS